MARTLDQLAEGEEARILRIGGRGAVRQRLMDMGVMRGARVLLKRRAPLGDPLQIAVKGYDLAIRQAEARYIEVETTDAPETSELNEAAGHAASRSDAIRKTDPGNP